MILFSSSRVIMAILSRVWLKSEFCRFGSCHFSQIFPFSYMWLSQVEIENHAGEEIFELALWPWEAREARSFEL